RYSDVAAAEFSAFNPFNLITVTPDQALVHTNRPDKTTNVLQHGIHGLSNGAIHQPWPKSPQLNGALEKWMAVESNDPAMLFDALLDQKSYRPEDHSDSSSQFDLEPEHSPIFIRDPTYGTRCSTVVAIDHNGSGIFIERRFAASGSAMGETRLSFSWPTS
ncbi:NRDE family protein, partial [Parasphingorhabdus sp.]|uniref:NRDE family protein n=1 Tax=Parasphingorhabdus sp. TaxID=2709688 RepID=UPI003C716585